MVDLQTALDDVQVEEKFAHDPECVDRWWPDSMPWGVSTPNAGIVAIFTTEAQAQAYRHVLAHGLLSHEYKLPYPETT